MIDIIELRILAEEHRMQVESLFSNKRHVTLRQEEALGKLLQSYSALMDDLPDARASRRADLKKEINRTRLSLSDLEERKKSSDFPESWTPEFQLKKIEVIEKLLKELGVTAVVKDEEIEFRDCDGVTILSLQIESEVEQPEPKN